MPTSLLRCAVHKMEWRVTQLPQGGLPERSTHSRFNVGYSPGGKTMLPVNTFARCCMERWTFSLAAPADLATRHPTRLCLATPRVLSNNGAAHPVWAVHCPQGRGVCQLQGWAGASQRSCRRWEWRVLSASEFGLPAHHTSLEHLHLSLPFHSRQRRCSRWTRFGKQQLQNLPRMTPSTSRCGSARPDCVLSPRMQPSALASHPRINIVSAPPPLLCLQYGYISGYPVFRESLAKFLAGKYGKGACSSRQTGQEQDSAPWPAPPLAQRWTRRACSRCQA